MNVCLQIYTQTTTKKNLYFSLLADIGDPVEHMSAKAHHDCKMGSVNTRYALLKTLGENGQDYPHF